MTAHYSDEVMQIFKRLVEAKRSGSLMASGRCYTDLNMLADIEAERQERAENKRERF